jgi:hypothetical protein
MNSDPITTHDLKTVQPWFDLLWKGEKTFEIRRNDRGGFMPGQGLRLREWKNNEFTGRYVQCQIDDVYEGMPNVADDAVVLTLKGQSNCTDALQEANYLMVRGR